MRGLPLYPLFVLFGLNAVDELDRSAFSVLAPNIREHFGLSVGGILNLTALILPVGIVLSIPVAHLADRRRRTGMAALGAATWGMFCLMTGLASSLLVLVVARMGSGLGKTVIDPTHNSLLADYYPPDVRARVYSYHRMANSVGQFVGPVAAGFVAAATSWRVPFFVLSVPTFVFVVLALRMREPERGGIERRARGVAGGEDPPLRFGDGWRLLWQIRSLRRLYFAFPFFSASILGIFSLLSLYYHDVFGLDERARGIAFAVSEPFQVVGLIFGARLIQSRLNQDPAEATRLLSVIMAMVAICLGGLAVAPIAAVAVGCVCLQTLLSSTLLPGLYSIGSLVLPARVRSLGFTAAGLWALPGVVALPVVGLLADRVGLRVAIISMMPLYVVGSAIVVSAAKFVNDDIDRSQADYDRAPVTSAT